MATVTKQFMESKNDLGERNTYFTQPGSWWEICQNTLEQQFMFCCKKKLVAYMNVHTICTRTEKEQARNLFTTKLFWVFASKNCQRVNSGWNDINMQILILFMTVENELNLMMLWTIWPWLYSRQWCFCYNVVATESDQYNNYYYRDFYDMHLRLRQLMLSISKATYYCLSYIQMKRTKKPVCMKTLILGTVNKTEM